MLIRNGERLSFGQILTSLCMGIGVVSGAMLLFAVAMVITESFARAITGASFEDMPEFMELLKHLAVILSFAIGSKYAARGLGAGIPAWALWAGVLVAVDSTLGWILGMTFEWEDVAIIVGTSGIVFGAEWIFRKAERGKA